MQGGGYADLCCDRHVCSLINNGDHDARPDACLVPSIDGVCLCLLRDTRICRTQPLQQAARSTGVWSRRRCSTLGAFTSAQMEGREPSPDTPEGEASPAPEVAAAPARDQPAAGRPGAVPVAVPQPTTLFPRLQLEAPRRPEAPARSFLLSPLNHPTSFVRHGALQLRVCQTGSGCRRWSRRLVTGFLYP